MSKQKGMDGFITWLETALVSATTIHDTLEAIPFMERNPRQHNRMVANGGKMTIIKNTLDYVKRHQIEGLTKR